MKINNDNLEVKYVIGCFKDLPTYPTTKDVVYLLIEWLMLNDKPDDHIFSDTFISNLIGKSSEGTKDVLSKLVKEEIFEHIKDTNTKSLYRIIKNPFL